MPNITEIALSKLAGWIRPCSWQRPHHFMFKNNEQQNTVSPTNPSVTHFATSLQTYSEPKFVLEKS